MSPLKLLIVFVPLEAADAVRKAAADAGAGHIGHYDSCSFSSRGIGRFRPLRGSHPAIGKQNLLEEVEEERIEMVVEESHLKQVLQSIISVHPYETPAIHVIAMEDYRDVLSQSMSER